MAGSKKAGFAASEAAGSPMLGMGRALGAGELRNAPPAHLSCFTTFCTAAVFGCGVDVFCCTANGRDGVARLGAAAFWLTACWLPPLPLPPLPCSCRASLTTC
jgi:hypothetical protein